MPQKDKQATGKPNLREIFSREWNRAFLTYYLGPLNVAINWARREGFLTETASGEGGARHADHAAMGPAPEQMSINLQPVSGRGQQTSDLLQESSTGKAITDRGAAKQGAKGDGTLETRQKQIMAFVESYQATYRCSPTIREIKENFGYTSYGTVYKQLKILQARGVLRTDWNSRIDSTRPYKEESRETEVNVPFMGLVAAGSPIQPLPGEESFSLQELTRILKDDSVYIMRLTGESLIDEGFRDRDLVAVSTEKEPMPGDLIVALIGDSATIKYFYPEGDLVRLQPANSTMHPIWVEPDEIKIVGVALTLIRWIE